MIKYVWKSTKEVEVYDRPAMKYDKNSIINEILPIGFELISFKKLHLNAKISLNRGLKWIGWIYSKDFIFDREIED